MKGPYARLFSRRGEKGPVGVVSCFVMFGSRRVVFSVFTHHPPTDVFGGQKRFRLPFAIAFLGGIVAVVRETTHHV